MSLSFFVLVGPYTHTHRLHTQLNFVAFLCLHFLASHATIIAFLRRSWPAAKNDGSFFHCHTALIGRFRIGVYIDMEMNSPIVESIKKDHLWLDTSPLVHLRLGWLRLKLSFMGHPTAEMSGTLPLYLSPTLTTYHSLASYQKKDSFFHFIFSDPTPSDWYSDCPEFFNW